MLYRVHPAWIQTHNFSGDKNWLRSSCKSKYHMIMTMMAPEYDRKSEDTTGVIRSLRSKERQYNVQKIKDKYTNNGPEN